MTDEQKFCPRCEEEYYYDDEYCQTCGYEFAPSERYSNDYVLQGNQKEYKILDLRGIEDEVTDEENLFAELSEITTIAGRYKQYSATGIHFMARINSVFAKYLLNQPEDIKIVDTELFNKRVITINGRPVTVYCDKEIVFK